MFSLFRLYYFYTKPLWLSIGLVILLNYLVFIAGISLF